MTIEGSWFGSTKGKQVFSLKRPERLCGLASLLVGNNGPFPLDNLPWSNADHSPLLGVELNVEFPTYIHGIRTTLLLYRHQTEFPDLVTFLVIS